MGVTNSLTCIGNCEPKDMKKVTFTPGDYGLDNSKEIPSAIHDVEAWNKVASVPWTPLPDIKIRVRIVKTRINFFSTTAQCWEKNEVALLKAKELLEGVLDGKCIDQKPTRARYSNFGPKKSILNSDNETYDITLPAWADIWRLKCVVAKILHVPAKNQIIICNWMNPESCIELNRPSTLLIELLVYFKQNSPKRNPRSLNKDSIKQVQIPSRTLDIVISIPSVVQSSEEWLSCRGSKMESTDKSSNQGNSEENLSGTLILRSGTETKEAGMLDARAEEYYVQSRSESSIPDSRSPFKSNAESFVSTILCTYNTGDAPAKLSNNTRSYISSTSKFGYSDAIVCKDEVSASFSSSEIRILQD